ncbi:MAG TPA: nucleotide exchange factor GrpE [Alphaproteobacteria bacterium]|nr:nucleotide exchange factor GrpE [Alphaproteobacteria bacterium]
MSDWNERREPTFSTVSKSGKPRNDEPEAAEKAAPESDAATGDAPERAGAEATAATIAAAAEARIAVLEGEVAQLKDQLLRALAETENTRRRARREVEDTAKYAIANFAKDVLTAPDNLRRALEAIPAERRQDDALLDKLAAGVELVERELQALFERYGIKKIDPLGQPFDHNFHQALFEVPSTDYPPGVVAQVLAPGYVIHDRLLRPAMVGVAKAASGGGANDDAGLKVDTTI